jgi:excisionase family DNA binding protein
MARRSTSHNSGLRLSDEELRAAFDSEWGLKFPPVLNVRQAAELAQVPVATIYDWSSRKQLTSCARRVGRHLRIHRDRFLTHIFSANS